MNALPPAVAAPPPGLTRFEIGVHGIADGLSSYVLVNRLWNQWTQGDWEEWPWGLAEASLALLVILLSAAIIIRRLRPELRGLRVLEPGLSGLVAVLGVIGAVATLVVMVSGATYKGSSPDGGGMEVFVGFFLFYPCAALIVLPFALNGSQISPRLRRRIGWLCCGLALLPFCVLLGSLGR
jgi:hypothetical protein